VYAGYPGGRVIAAEAATGMPTWAHELPAGSGLLKAMTVSDDIVYIAPEGGPVSAITT
jgi:hypothetical protein